MTLRSRLQRLPLLGYFGLSYGISWGGILVVLSFTGFDLVWLRPLDTGLIFIVMLLGPSTAGLAMTTLLDGRRGLRELVSSLARWRVSGRWYGVALLTMPLLLFATLWLLSTFVDPAFAPGFRWPLFAIGLVAGTFEEVGWTGFATPCLLARQHPLIAGLSLGLAWALWHALVDFRQNFNTHGVLWLLEFALLYIAALTAYRLLMTYVYAHTQSLLLAVLMHASLHGVVVRTLSQHFVQARLRLARNLCRYAVCGGSRDQRRAFWRRATARRQRGSSLEAPSGGR